MGFPDWTTEPVHGLKLSTGGLLALADLSTIAHRTVIAGGSSWMDCFLLAPGLQHQQEVDVIAQRGNMGVERVADAISAVETLQDGKAVTFAIKNAATRHYIQSIASPGKAITLDVGSLPRPRNRYRLMRSGSGLHATVWAEDRFPDLGWVSQILYLISPALTVVSMAMLVLLQDWWCLGSLLALICARVMNIVIIKRRARPHQSTEASAGFGADQSPKPVSTPSDNSSRITEYVVTLGDGHSTVRLRGVEDDLQAITASIWLQPRTHVDSHLEAAAKLLVYGVASLSGNMTQAGAFIFMSLLLVSAGLLALSNAHAKSFNMNGRVAAPLPGKEMGTIQGGGAGQVKPATASSKGDGGESWKKPCGRPESFTVGRSGVTEDLVEKGQAGPGGQGQSSSGKCAKLPGEPSVVAYS